MKKLIVGGCSFTFETWNWPTYVARDIGCGLKNTGMGSMGNGLISKRLIYEIEQHLKIMSAQDIVVGVMWSGIDRNEFYVNKHDLTENLDGWVENPTNVTNQKKWLITNSHWKFKKSVMWYENYHTDVGSMIKTIENILRLQWYLEHKGIKYFMTTYMDIFQKNLKGYKIIEHEEVNYLYNLIDQSKFLEVNGCYEWLLENYKEDGFPKNKPNVWGTHPTKEGHKEFATKVILPHIKKHILNE